MKYYYGNSYKEAISNNPVELDKVEILQAYEANYNVVIPANEFEEEFWVIIFAYKDSDEDLQERYDDFDDARADYNYMIQEDSNNYKYAVLQHVIESEIDGETIEEVDTWGLE